MKIISCNLNGIRSALSKGLSEWLEKASPDVLCVQETKAQPEQIPVAEFMMLGYNSYMFSAMKKGYSGVAIFCKQKPDKVVCGMNIEKYDNEGRMIRADFGDLSIISVYHPSGSSGEERQNFKMIWLNDFLNYINELRKERPKLIICGDYNIAHKEIDIHNPKANANISGFLPEEREWFDKFLANGYIDSFRHLNKDPKHYSWWSFRAKDARNRKIGWRIDYNIVTENLENKINSVNIYPDVILSDHCPIEISIK